MSNYTKKKLERACVPQYYTNKQSSQTNVKMSFRLDHIVSSNINQIHVRAWMYSFASSHALTIAIRVFLFFFLARLWEDTISEKKYWPINRSQKWPLENKKPKEWETYSYDTKKIVKVEEESTKQRAEKT